MLRTGVRGLTEEITDISNELEVLGMVDELRELRATKLLQVSQYDLKRYYDQILRRARAFRFANQSGGNLLRLQQALLFHPLVRMELGEIVLPGVGDNEHDDGAFVQVASNAQRREALG